MSSEDKGYQPVFVMFPSRIWNLPGITLQLVKFYEKIFQFWNKSHDCFVKNETLKEYTGMSSDSSISSAFQYFEALGEMKRIRKNGRRFIIQPRQSIEDRTEVEANHSVDNSVKNSTETAHTLATARPDPRYSETRPLATARHNINKLNASKINKSFCSTEKHKKKKSVDNLSTYYVDRNTQSQEAKTAKRGSMEAEEAAMLSLPKSLRPSRFRNKQDTCNIRADENQRGQEIGICEDNEKRHSIQT